MECYSGKIIIITLMLGEKFKEVLYDFIYIKL